jgi:hypothetical protein
LHLLHLLLRLVNPLMAPQHSLLLLLLHAPPWLLQRLQHTQQLLRVSRSH